MRVMVPKKKIHDSGKFYREDGWLLYMRGIGSRETAV